MFRIILLKLVKKIIRKYFSEGLCPVYGSGDWENLSIAWSWTFEDEKWGKYRNAP